MVIGPVGSLIKVLVPATIDAKRAKIIHLNDKPNFIEKGDIVSEGDVLCVIEAMKLFNEIESEHSGKIVKILVDDASPVEFDQPLFLVDPS